MPHRGPADFLPGFDNRRRAFIIASFLAVTTVLSAIGLFPWQPPAILLAWLVVILLTGRLLARQTTEAATVRVATVGFCADALFVTGCVFYLGGALWLGTAFFLFLVMVSASMLPLRQSIWVAVCAAASCAVLVLGEASGAFTRPPFFGIPDYTGEYRLSVTTVLIVATTIALALTVQQGLVGAIRRSEQSHRLVLEAASDMILTLDADGRVRRVNAAVIEQTGHPRGDLIGVQMSSLVADGDRAAFERQLEHVRLGARVPFEVSYTHRSGAPRWMAGTLTPIPLGDAEAKMLLIARDTTQSRAADRERERLRNELAQALRIQALGRLVSGVAHELNNPLTVILTTADDLLDGRALEPDDLESMAIVRQQAHRARAIVRDMAAFVRSGSERKHERIRPSAALAEALALARTDIDLTGARLKHEIAADIGPVEIDRAGFDQVVTNIVLNAAQAAGKNGTVAVRARSTDKVCEIVVEDDGPGIASDVLAHIFEPFYTTKIVGQGAGLGLSLSLGIVQHYNGTITAENRSRSLDGTSGARFTVRLPLAPDAVSSTQEGPVAQGGASASRRSPQGGTPRRTVLIVDDEAAIRRSLRRYLERFGWTVEELPSGVEALSLLVSRDAGARYAAVISDVKMPGMTGLELCARVQVEAPHMLSRFILTSGDLPSYDQELRDYAIGGTASKPYDVDQLRALLDRVASAPAASGG